MKLLFDLHHSRLAAARLRELGHDVEAAADQPNLASLSDGDLLAAAAQADRVLVTEDVADFGRLVVAWAAVGTHHSAIIFTSPRRFHRGSRRYPTNLVTALRRLLDAPPDNTADWVHWLG